MTAAESAAAAQQNANQAKNIQNQSLVQDTSSTNAAIQQEQQLIAALQGQNPLTQSAYANPAGVENPANFSFTSPQTMGSMVPSKQGQAPIIAPQGANPNSSANAVGNAAGLPTPSVPTPGAVQGSPSVPTAVAGAATGARQVGVGPAGYATMVAPGLPGSNPSYSQHPGGYTFSGNSGTGEAESAPTLAAAEALWQQNYGNGQPPPPKPVAAPATSKPIGAPAMRSMQPQTNAY
jgi:hypothetical protein